MARAKPFMPRWWLFTDEEAHPDEGSLMRAVAALPRGGGVVFRHHGWPRAERARLLEALRRLAQRRRLVVLVARSPRRRPGEGEHRGRWAPPGRRPAPASAAVHSMAEAVAARRARVPLVFVSPVLPTRSHPGRRAIGRFGFARLARAAGAPAVALGGMTPGAFARLAPMGAVGMAAIGYWSSRSSTRLTSAVSS